MRRELFEDSRPRGVVEVRLSRSVEVPNCHIPRAAHFRRAAPDRRDEGAVVIVVDWHIGEGTLNWSGILYPSVVTWFDADVVFDQVDLPGGRKLDVRVSGPADGMPLVFHHGTPGAATPIRAIERAAVERGLRLIRTSRPGYGDSTRQPGRSVADVVDDTGAVLEALGAQRCLVAGWSGGGPHALACAARLNAAEAALVIAGVAPYGADGLDWMVGMGEDNVAEFGAALQGEDVLRPLLDAARDGLKDVTVAGLIESLSSLLPDVDRAVLSDEFGEDMVAAFHEGLRIGVDGWLDDDLAFSKPWGFEFDEISTPVMIWQGSEDLMVPFAHGQWLASRLPEATSHLESGEGHLSIGIGAIGRMLDELVSGGRKT